MILWRLLAAVACPRRALRIRPSIYDVARATDTPEVTVATVGRDRGAEALLARHVYDGR